MVMKAVLQRPMKSMSLHVLRSAKRLKLTAVFGDSCDSRDHCTALTRRQRNQISIVPRAGVIITIIRHL
jgi:hypothetical protein